MIMIINQKEVNQETFISFLQRTKEGKYAPINEESLNTSRVTEQTEDSYSDSDYYFSVR